MSAGDLVKTLSPDGLPQVKQVMEGTDMQNLASKRVEGLNLGSLGIDSALTGGGVRGAFSELRDSFVSIVGEGRGMGLSPQQTAEKFLSANSGKFSVPDLGAFLESTNDGGDFVKRVRDAAVMDLRGLFRQPKRQLLELPYFEYLDTGFAYFTSKGFADGLSPQETAQNLIDEALRTDQFEGLVGLLGGGKFELGKVVGGSGLDKYATDVLLLLEKKIPLYGVDPLKDLKTGFALSVVDGVIEGLRARDFPHFGSREPGLVDVRYRGRRLEGSEATNVENIQDIVGQLSRLSEFLTFLTQFFKITGDAARVAELFLGVLTNQGLTVEEFLASPTAQRDSVFERQVVAELQKLAPDQGLTVEEFLGSPAGQRDADFGRQVVAELQKLAPSRRLEIDEDELRGECGDQDFTQFASDCYLENVSPARCGRLYSVTTTHGRLRRLAQSNDERLLGLANTGVAVPATYIGSVKEEILSHVESKEDTRRLQQSFGSILDPKRFLANSYGEIAEEGTAAGLAPDTTSGRYLAALGALGPPGGALQKVIQSGGDYSDYMKEIMGASIPL
eukprot:GHVN01004386.1.p1 GENE.GHVN01004386.1~~GHVN01004386.1.p1  ORF type:complete len:640 (+),score=70.35 GHVN01004386.1:239-1921(+)